MYANFKLRFKDKELKDLMWGAATAYLEETHNKKMNDLRRLSNEAYDWLKNIPPQQWCKYMMSARPKCDMLSNNLCESFNNYIKEARDMPILTMLEALRRQIMCRIYTKKQWIEKYAGKVCPRIQDKLDVIKNKSLQFECYLSADGRWEVTVEDKGWFVDLRNHTCSCREWSLTGIPCLHATCAILQERKHPEDFTSDYYSIDMYKRAYCYSINPIPDHSQWKSDNSQVILPPVFKNQPGRPKKVRYKGADEISVGDRVTRKGLIQTCSNSGDTTHNRRKCERPPMNPPPPLRTKKVTFIVVSYFN